jgi:DtxR family Mn-dependent transcriptional regulator
MKMNTLSASLEDYVEAIWILSIRGKVVRVKDIAEILSVKSPSVVGALKVLVEKGLIAHERYGYIELSQEGEALARDVYRRHKTLAKFFNEILGVDLATAARDACAIEHSVSDATIRRISMFMRFAEGVSEERPSWLQAFRDHVSKNAKPEAENSGEDLCEAVTSEVAVMLDMIPAGQEARIVRIVGEKDIKRKLLDMGLVPGVRLRVERVAPMGDPIDVVVKGYHLSLRKAEAASVIVEEIR